MTAAVNPRHRNQEFLAFLKQAARAYPDGELHLVMHHDAAHKHRNVRDGRVRRRCQAAELAAVRETGLMWAKALRAFQVGKARTSHEGPWSWMRRSRVASAQLSWPACHLTKASDSAVM